MSARPRPAMFVYSVGQLVTYLRELLETDTFLADVWVGGEIANLSRSQAGHRYFTLRDSIGSIRCVLFARQAAMVRTALQDGTRVLVHGRVALYEQRGEVQLIVDFVRPEGEGIEQARLERLMAKLEEEGLFDQARKRPLPHFPRRIGVVTSAHGAVFHDICHVLERRWPLAEVLLADTPVQGDAALAGVPEAIRRFNALPDIDVVIIARGGGGAEELAPFNDEVVVRAIYGSVAPTISAIGHETNTTIADLVADVRAPTPSAAAELAAPDRRQVLSATEAAAMSLTGAMSRAIVERNGHVEALAFRLPALLPPLEKLRWSLEDAERAMERAALSRCAALGERVAGQQMALAALSPLATLARGYAIVQRADDRRLVRSAKDAPPGTMLDVRLAEGAIRAETVP
ncbi:MAG TPA: exodeoxyribonuclease VII large subunit [Dehalococcoidia bacterium]|nr:exodeoxyribonuclease VII large subunit [Dehalococcoidia bacterium]